MPVCAVQIIYIHRVTKEHGGNMGGKNKRKKKKNLLNKSVADHGGNKCQLLNVSGAGAGRRWPVTQMIQYRYAGRH